MKIERLDNDVLTIRYEAIPNEKNIEFVFQRIVFSLISLTGYESYQEDCDIFQNILKTVIIVYSNTKDLMKIDENQLRKVKEKLFELDGKYILAGWYVQ